MVRALARNTTLDTSRPKAVCVCQEEGPLLGTAGSLFQFGAPGTNFDGRILFPQKVACMVEGFDGNGDAPETAACHHFAVLPR
jgi:hypothetical protein